MNRVNIKISLLFLLSLAAVAIGFERLPSPVCMPDDTKCLNPEKPMTSENWFVNGYLPSVSLSYIYYNEDDRGNGTYYYNDDKDRGSYYNDNEDREEQEHANRERREHERHEEHEEHEHHGHHHHGVHIEIGH